MTMKLKNGFILRDVGGECVVVPSGADIDLNGMITLNATAKTLWQRLEQEATAEELVATLLAEYEVDEATARGAVERFIATLQENDFLA